MTNQIRILVADDNIEFGEIVCDYLSNCDDIEVIGRAEDGLEAIQLINELNPDIVILDIIMPHMDGLAVLEHYYKVPASEKPMFIILSAVGQDKIKGALLFLYLRQELLYRLPSRPSHDVAYKQDFHVTWRIPQRAFRESP